MAIAGLHNVSSAFGPSLFGDSRPTTRASALLRMWRELENEHVIGQSYKDRRPIRYNPDTEYSSTPKSATHGSEDGDNMSRHSYESENQGGDNGITPDGLGEVERERERQRMDCGSKGHPSFGFHLNNSVRDGAGCQIEEVREGLVVTNRESGRRRPIRRLWGRQNLLDLLVRAQSERKRELSALAEHRLVSGFAHRNRIQALLRGRFLHNEKLDLDERPSSKAETELGLLSQRKTVSNLRLWWYREGFLSKLDNSASASVNSSEADENNGELESTCREEEVSGFCSQSNLELESTCREEEVSHGYPSARQQQDVDSRLGEDISSVTIGNESDFVCFSESLIENNEPASGANFMVQAKVALTRGEEFQESVIELRDNDAFTDERCDGSREDSYLSFSEPFDNNVEVQESHQDWPHHDEEEAIVSKLERTNTLCLPDDDDDDDNVRNMELRELFRLRRVSSLLRSSFRESLNQVLQSHVERLRRASGDRVEQDQEQLNVDPTSALSDGNFERSPPTPFAASQPFSDEFRGTDRFHHTSNVQLETDWEEINELKIDMARLQQRMNNMQSMLGTCMEMQSQSQHSVRQELSSALHLSFFSRDEEDTESVDNRLPGESLWDYIRKGICCLCGDSKIDTLLYRCGHMCSCSKCGDNLVRCKGKCPMCQAPAVMVVQAFFIQ
ncbi:hypothetical protein OROGR_002613 [Orobanche gracilis]